jgi:hypothetical protein
VTELSIFSDVVDRRLGRHVVHDEVSWNYALPDVIAYGNARLPRAVQHARVIPVLDQGEVGSCTANALLGCLGTEPFASMLRDRDYAPVDLSTFDEALALAVYHDETILDEREIPGVYPPDDTGSAGLYAMKVARNRQWCRAYRHGFAFSASIAALAQRGPIMVGSVWIDSMFEVDRTGTIVVDRGGRIDGGHEYVVDGYDLDEGVAFMTNSWGTSWGREGTAKIRLGDLRWLLSSRMQGDVVQPVIV